MYLQCLTYQFGYIEAYMIFRNDLKYTYNTTIYDNLYKNKISVNKIKTKTTKQLMNITQRLFKQLTGNCEILRSERM